MKCKDCSACYQVFYDDEQTISDYLCYGVQEPFVIADINNECTEYPEKRDATLSVDILDKVDHKTYYCPKPYVDDKGIWVPTQSAVEEGLACTYKEVISKEMFVEAYNKWIKGVEPSEDIYRLNPCFVCGSTIIVEPHGDTLVVQCTGCGTRLEYKGTMNSLAAFWNDIIKEK